MRKILFILGLSILVSGCTIDMRPYNLYVNSAPLIDVGQLACHPDSSVPRRELCDPNLHI